MELINTIVKFISDVGASAMLPFVIAVLGLYFRIGVKKAVRNGLMVGIGFLGINTALGILTGAMGNISGYYQNLGSDLLSSTADGRRSERQDGQHPLRCW